jgi:hypothetical protein
MCISLVYVVQLYYNSRCKKHKITLLCENLDYISYFSVPSVVCQTHFNAPDFSMLPILHFALNLPSVKFVCVSFFLIFLPSVLQVYVLHSLFHVDFTFILKYSLMILDQGSTFIISFTGQY